MGLTAFVYVIGINAALLVDQATRRCFFFLSFIDNLIGHIIYPTQRLQAILNS